MKLSIALVAVAALAVLAYAGGGGSWWDIDDARMATMMEIKINKDGMHEEMEYHIDPMRVPPAIRAAMDAVYPGGPYTGAEKEYEGGHLYYELTREVNGMEVEAMFTPDGQLHAHEIQVAESAVPQAVRDAIAASYGDGTVNKWEEIKDGAGALVEYHVKLTEAGKNYKVVVQPSGYIPGAYLEVPAEIEVPAPPR